MLLSQHAQVVDLADGVLTLGFSGPGPRENFGTGGSAVAAPASAWAYQSDTACAAVKKAVTRS